MSLNKLNKRLEIDGQINCRWLRQDFVDELLSIGEWRVYIMQGVVSHVILTEWSSETELLPGMANGMWSLEELT
jgi:hypothetical protein